MRFMMIMYPDLTAWKSPPTAEVVGPMMKYNEELAKAGVLLALDGLAPPAQGARLYFDGQAKPRVVDGPFAEAKEIVGGYWLIQVKSRAEAIEWATRIPKSDQFFVEVRQIMEVADFDPSAQKLLVDSPVAAVMNRK